MRTPIVRSFIMCEHIREEMRGKLTLVGTYADTIEINVPFPASIHPLFFLFHIDGKRAGGKTVTLSLFSPKGRRPLFSLPFKIEQDNKTSAAAAFGWTTPKFETPGVYRVRLALDGRTIFSMPLYVRPGAPQKA